ncbi:unnamed protein product [marine sediment metagenome]|uniref:Uncharacterized protein n=1 Tax=marine sediment metagenome TaxID=412755 RepID=X1BQQ4_9ZZZZ
MSFTQVELQLLSNSANGNTSRSTPQGLNVEQIKELLARVVNRNLLKNVRRTGPNGLEEMIRQYVLGQQPSVIVDQQAQMTPRGFRELKQLQPRQLLGKFTQPQEQTIISKQPNITLEQVKQTTPVFCLKNLRDQGYENFIKQGYNFFDSETTHQSHTNQRSDTYSYIVFYVS